MSGEAATPQKWTAAEAVALVMAEVGAVGKDRKTGGGGPQYSFRGIDDVLNALAGPIHRYGLVLAPQVLSCDVRPHPRQDLAQKGWTTTHLLVAYHVIGPDGSRLPEPVTVFALADDSGDKGPGKAMSYAYKYMAFQLFCLPTDDPSMDLEARSLPAYEPVEPTILEEDQRKISAEFDKLGDPDLRASVARAWAAEWGHPKQVKTAQFLAALGSARKLVADVQNSEPFEEGSGEG